MIIIHNNLIPWKGYKCINLFGILFVRGDQELSDIDIRHEKIHTRQMLELLIIGFYIWYLIEWILRGMSQIAYYYISFEQEAYNNEHDPDYLKNRKLWSFLKYYEID